LLLEQAQGLESFTNIAEVATSVGYAEWASGYDSPANPFFHLQERHFFPRLLREDVHGTVLDVAGGTGRVASIFAQRGSRVLVVDRSREMLEQAAIDQNLEATHLAQADYMNLPVANNSVELVTCSLALTHTENIDLPISEFARVLRPGGRAMICDIHPTAVLLGWQAFFQRKTGGVGFIRNHLHNFDAYTNTFSRAGLRILELTEVPFDDDSLRLSSGGDPQLELGLIGAYSGLPALVIWIVTAQG
jgi:ubiquinone/menaquinone biosynthesis C-methylase UbiE